ncbi:transmembrane protein, putative (macronuclear) [Tetrahymena thermophila SB210]|uniref:Transmembrane protein, putative n=1 Tax=Tetrahymena thermophila (strain SB210) TaxID=312017 RepID=I7M281_TETTS|nr:transmembrane protein, putative [Tetrahymena thermophila SB210]EAR99504.2 transmembrane protein, putative [Tetrahymena thermophila SB210]|eukprot:XP_001019749.2 transmembrane protein, putative [Tetrahymena thermophila SB210]
MQRLSQNQQGRQKTRKKQVLMIEKAYIFLKIIGQAFSYLIFYYENTISLDIQSMLLPLVCFFLGFFINFILVYRFHSHNAFTCFHIILISFSVMFAVETNAVDYNQNQKQIKMFMILIYYSCILIGRINFGNRHAALMVLMLIIVFMIYQIILFYQIIDLLFMIAFLLYNSFVIWKYFRLLDELSNFQEELKSHQYKNKLEKKKLKLRIQKEALKEGISDYIFFTYLQQNEQHKLRFYQINRIFQQNFDKKYMQNLMSRMKVNQKSDILKIQKKIYKLLTEYSSSSFEDFVKNISQERQNNMINQQNQGSLAHFNNVDNCKYHNSNTSEVQDEQHQSVQDQDHMANQRKNVFNFDNKNQQKYQMNGLEQQLWFLDSLKKCISNIKEQINRDPNHYQEQRLLVNSFNMQEIILVLLFWIQFKSQKKSGIGVQNCLLTRTKLQDVEIQHENMLYSANLFKCKHKSQWSLFFSMSKKQSFSTSDTTSNTNTDETTQRLLQFFKTRTEKFSRCITSLLCKFDSIKNFNANNEQELNQLAFQFEYLRMITKDMEEYREYLQEQQGFNANVRDQVIKIQQKNISQFKFKHLFEEVRSLFSQEVNLKSTTISLQEINQGECLLNTDYEKLKRILILLIENSLNYQKVGTIDIQVKEEKSNLICIKLIDSNNTINERVIEDVNTKGYSESGSGFGIITLLAKSITQQQEKPFLIVPDKVNDRTYYVVKISKNLHEEYYNQTYNNISQNVFQEAPNEPKERDVSNNSNQQLNIDQLIRNNQTQLHDGSQVNGKNPSLPIVNSNLNSPLKIKSQVDVKIQFNNIQIKLPDPYFYYGVQQKKANKNVHDNNGSNINIFDRAGTNNFLQINQNINSSNNNTIRQNSFPNLNNNSPYPQTQMVNNHEKKSSMFLIVSCDIKISASLYQLLLNICNNKKELVKHANNKDKYKDLLGKYYFEFILIDKLEEIQFREIVQLINQYYRNKKQNQKIIFFDYNISIYRNLEAEIPLIQQNDYNINDTKSDFKLQIPSQINQYFIDQNNYNGNYKNGFLEKQNASYTYKIPPNITQSQHNLEDIRFQPNKTNSRESSQNESLESVSVPNEPQNQNKNKSNFMGGGHQIDRQDYGINTARSMNKNPNETDILQYSINNLVDKGNNTSQNKFQTNNLNHNNGFNSKKVNFVEDETKNKSEDLKIKKLNLQSPQMFQLSQAPHPHVAAQDTEQNSIKSSTYRGRAITHSPDDRRNSPSNPPLTLKKQNTGKSSKKQLYVRTDQINKSYDLQQKQIELAVIKNSQIQQANIFSHKYIESIEVAQSLKFFYYSIQQPFGYTQIYEAVHHMDSIRNLSHLNFNFFNLNTSYIYYQ